MISRPPEALGRGLADELVEVVLAAVEGAGEAVEGDTLDGRAELGPLSLSKGFLSLSKGSLSLSKGHARASSTWRAVIVLLSCSSMCSTWSSAMMMYGM